MLQVGRGAADRYPWRVWGALTVFRPHWVCPAHRCVLSPSTLLRLPAALYGAGPALRAVPVFGFPQKRRLGWACVLCLPWPEQLRQPGAWRAHSPQVRCTLSPPRSRPQFLHTPCVCSGELVSSCDPLKGCQPSKISGSLCLETGSLFAGLFGGGCCLWGQVCPYSLPPDPFLLPPVGDGLVRSQLALLWNFSVLPLFLNNAAHSAPFSPHLLVADVSIWSTFLLGVTFRQVICGFYFSSQLGCLLRFENFPQTHPWEGFLVFGNSLYHDSLPGWVSIPNSFVCLFIFYILSYLLSKTLGYLSGCLMPSARDQNLFCGVFSAFKCSFNKFVGKKVVSPSYSSAILAPPLETLFRKKRY